MPKITTSKDGTHYVIFFCILVNNCGIYVRDVWLEGFVRG